MAIKKIVADRYLLSQGGTENYSPQPYTYFVSVCIDAARRNICLARWIRDISPRCKLLHQELHAVFSSAVVILLHELAFFRADAQDLSNMSFVMHVFEEEAGTENKYAMDCSSVLKGLNFFVESLPRAAQPPSVSQTATTDGRPSDRKSQVVASTGEEFERNLYMQGTTSFGLPGDSHSIVEQNDALQTELQAWLDDDYLELYNDMLL